MIIKEKKLKIFHLRYRIDTLYVVISNIKTPERAGVMIVFWIWIK